jgi:hypothetical protein
MKLIWTLIRRSQSLTRAHVHSRAHSHTHSHTNKRKQVPAHTPTNSTHVQRVEDKGWLVCVPLKHSDLQRRRILSAAGSSLRTVRLLCFPFSCACFFYAGHILWSSEATKPGRSNFDVGGLKRGFLVLVFFVLKSAPQFLLPSFYHERSIPREPFSFDEKLRQNCWTFADFLFKYADFGDLWLAASERAQNVDEAFSDSTDVQNSPPRHRTNH